MWLCEFTKYNSTKNFKAQPQIFFFFTLNFTSVGYIRNKLREMAGRDQIPAVAWFLKWGGQCSSAKCLILTTECSHWFLMVIFNTVFLFYHVKQTFTSISLDRPATLYMSLLLNWQFFHLRLCVDIGAAIILNL